MSREILRPLEPRYAALRLCEDAEEPPTVLLNGRPMNTGASPARPSQAAHVAYKFLPPWAYEESVHLYAEQQHAKGSQVGMRWATTPTVSIALLASFFTVYQDVVSFCLASATAACDGGTGVYRMSLWGLVSPLLLPRLFMELQLLRYCIIPYLQGGGSFGNEWCFPVTRFGFAMFVMSCILLSTAKFVDNTMDSYFAASALHTVRVCSQEQDISVQAIWNVVLDRSLVLPIFRHLSLETLIWFGWFSTFFPLVHAAFVSLPRPADLGKFLRIAQMPVGAEASYEDLGWRTLSGEQTSCGDAAYVAGSALGLSSIMCQTLEYPRARALKLHERGRGSGKLFYLLRNCLDRCMGRILFTDLMELACQLHLRISLLALARAQLKLGGGEVSHTVSLQFVGGIALQLLLAGTRLHSIVQHLLFARDVFQWQANAHEDADKDVQSDRRKSLILVGCLAVSAVVFAALMLLALAKVIAMSVCDYALWNLGSGCVDLSGLRGAGLG